MQIKTRAEWGARKPKRRTPQNEPATMIWCHHGANGTPVKTFDDVARMLRAWQRMHMDDPKKKYADIAYNFAIDQAGRIWDLRGGTTRPGATKGVNKGSLAFVFVGDFDTEEPSKALKESAAWLLNHVNQQGWATSNQFTGGHREAPKAKTACPGDKLQAAIPEINQLAAGGTHQTAPPLSATAETVRITIELARLYNRWRGFMPTDQIGNWVNLIIEDPTKETGHLEWLNQQLSEGK